MKIKTLEITLGEELFRPFEYEQFRVGPMTVTIELGEKETIAEAAKRVRESMGPVMDEMFIFARDKYHEHHAIKG